MTITSCFQKIIDEQKEMGYLFPGLLNPPAENSEIELVECKLNIRFSKELKELYSFANGSKTQGLPYLKRGLMPCQDFLDLATAVHMYNVNDELQDAYKIRLANEEADAFYNWKTEYIPGNKLFPVLFDGSGGCHWVDLNEDQPYYGKVFRTVMNGECPDYVYDSLVAMFQVISAGYEEGIIFTDDEGNLRCDYKKFGKLAQKLNPGIQYWKAY